MEANPSCGTDDPNAAEVVKISTGQLYILRPGNIRTPKECMCVHQGVVFTPTIPTDVDCADLMRLWRLYVAFLTWITTFSSWSPKFSRKATRSCLKTKKRVSSYCYTSGIPTLNKDTPKADAERVFLISEELEFRAGDNDGEPHFIWRDLEGDIDEFYQFVAPGTNAPTKAFFETCMYRAMYERKYKRNADATQDGDLEEFIWR